MLLKSAVRNPILYYVTFAIISYFVILKTINVSLIYHVQQPLFLIDFDVFMQSFKEPGGVMKYLGAFIAELFSFPVIGTMVLVLLISTLSFVVYISSKKVLGTTVAQIVSALIMPISLSLFTQYEFGVHAYLYLIVSYVFVCIYRKLMKFQISPWLLVLLIILNAITSFVILGGFGLMFSTAIIIFSTLARKNTDRKSIFVLLAIIASAIIIPFIGVKTIFQLVPLADAYFGDFYATKYYQISPLFYALVLCILIIELMPFLPFNKINTTKLWAHGIVIMFLSVTLWYFPIQFIDKDKKVSIEFDYLAYTAQWDAITKKVNNDLLKKRLIAFQANRAVYHKGNFLDLCFKIPQYFGEKGILVEHDVMRQILIPASDIYYDLGYINESRHWAHEAYTSFGKQARILRRLVQVNIVNAKYNTAEKYLALLNKSWIQKEWALAQEQYLYNEKAIASNREYALKRSHLPTVDFFATRNSPIDNLAALVDQHANGRMAFEYLIFDHMLKHELVHILKYIPRFKQYGYKRLPFSVQEAILIYMVKSNNNTLDLSGYQIDPRMSKRFQNYSTISARARTGDQGSKKTLKDKYSDSYWYYLQFISPLTRSKS